MVSLSLVEIHLCLLVTSHLAGMNKGTGIGYADTLFP
jgi:hypothetical protein